MSLPSSNYFPRFPVRPPFHRFRVAPSPRGSPQAISHNFPSVHPFIASVSLLPLGPLPKLFPTVSFPSTLSLLPYWKPSFVQPSYFHPPYAALPQLVPRVGPTISRNNRIHGICPENLVPKALHFSVAPSLHSSPPAISTLPTQLSPSYFHVLDPQFFRTIALMEIVLKTPVPKALHFSVALSLRSSPPAISTSWTHSFSGQSQ